VKTVACILECDPSDVRRLLDSGEIEGHRIGKRGVRVYLDSVAAYQAREARRARVTRAPVPDAPPPPRLMPRASQAAHKAAVAALRAAGIP
jgi:excisionase family DNA binding protein